MSDFVKHKLHAPDRIWQQSNCSIDLWIELLNHWDFEPVAALPVTVALDYEGDQFTFFKIPSSDLTRLFGVQLLELSIYDNLEKHIELQVNNGRIVLVEVDGFFLPDTESVSYQIKHTKTTIGIDSIDKDKGILGYFHNDIYGQLNGENYKNLITHRQDILFPYVEFVKKNSEKRDINTHDVSTQLLAEHIGNIPKLNPIESFRKAFNEKFPEVDTTTFHEYAFNNFRMLGSNFELLGSYLHWLDYTSDAAIRYCREIADQAKVLQFRGARMIARKKFDPCDAIFDRLEKCYAMIQSDLK